MAGRVQSSTGIFLVLIPGQASFFFSCDAGHIRRMLRALESLDWPIMFSELSLSGFSARVTQAAVRAIDWVAERTLPADPAPMHQRTGRRGEEDAYFYLRRLGYVMVARNFRSARRRGEIDLIAWDKDVLCFIEVKTRTTRDVKPAEAAVDRDKQRGLVAVAHEYLGHVATPCRWRFDVVTVYYEHQSSQPLIELFRNAFPLA
jgi:putative endonuclease